MHFLMVRNRMTQEVLGDRILLAANPWLKLRGLMGTREIRAGSGMLFPRTNAVHGFFMQYGLRLVYLDRNQAVLATCLLRPWRVGPIVPRARYVLELPEHALVSVGDVLEWEFATDL